MVYSAKNDRDSVKHEQIEKIVRNLAVSYAYLRRSFQAQLPIIRLRLRAGDVTGAVKLARDAYRLPSSLLRRVGYSANINVPAAVQVSFEIPSHKLKHITLFFQQSEKHLVKLPEYRLLHYIAHELAHARMYFDRHMFMQSEFATDVLALMVAGSRVAYERDMISRGWQYGYIRGQLLPEVFRCLDRYTEVIYSK